MRCSMAKKWKGCIALILGGLLVFGIEFLYDIRSENSLFSNSVTAALIFGMAAYTAYRCLNQKKDKRSWILGGAAAAVFAVSMCMGHSLNYTETVWNTATFGAIVCIWPFLILLCASGLVGINRKAWTYEETNVSTRQILLYAGVLLLLWLPTLLASWPGIYGYDSEFQLNQYFHGDFNSHHPVLHTLLVGSTMKLGLALGGTPQAGAAVYTILQLLIMAGILAFVVYKLQKKGTPKWFCFIMLGFYGLHPANSMSVISCTKDTIFAGLMILLVMELLEMTEEPERFWHSWKRVAYFAVLLLLVMAFRNNAFHMLLLFVPFFVWAFRKYWKRAVLVLCGCLALHAGITGPGYEALGIQKGSPREMCSVLMQTAARAYNLVYLDLTEEEKEGFYSIIDEDGLKSYLPRFADPVKAYFDGEKFVEEPGQFLKAWTSVGMRHTKIYVDAFLTNNLGYWYPGAMLPNNSGNHYVEYWANGNSADLKVEMRPVLKGLYHLYDQLCNESMHQHIPVISFLLPIGTFVWVLFAGFLVLIHRRLYKRMIPILPLLLYLGTLFLGPVVAMRYAFPIIVCTPIILYLMLIKEKQHG